MNDQAVGYLERCEQFLTSKMQMEKLSNVISNLRLATLLSGILLTVLTYYYASKPLSYGLFCIILIFFIFLVVRHDRIIKQINIYSSLAEINKACQQRIAGDWIHFADDGKEYMDSHHPYINDLDIFGHGSLFHWINTANSYHGREFLKDMLANPLKDVDSIKRRQKAVKELAAKLGFCQNLQCWGMAGKDISSNPENLIIYAESNSSLFPSNSLNYLLYILPGITIVSFGMYQFLGYSLYIPLGSLLLQIIINIAGSLKVTRIIASLYSHKNKIEVYQKMLEVIEKEEFDDEYLTELQAVLFHNTKSASQQIKILDNMVGALSIRTNPFIHVIINNILFWDFHWVLALERWQETSGRSFRGWIHALGTFEALCSLALIAQLNPQWSYPAFDLNGLLIKTTDMGHPLINEKARVANDFVIDNQICIVTGSNMSGKTTLLRTIGVNLVLAYAGAAVCARNFKCSILDIYTSMRVTDDLNAGISTFYAELLRIKMIIEYSKEQQPMLFLIDEVFRGTNTRDRVVGARNVLMNLNKSWILGLISTHDFELCDFENDNSGRIINLHFTETYSEGEISFDYQLKPGRCNTANAKYLMKLVGIEIID
ncbi:muts-related protein, family [hydrocarbon metagenome]|uniref:Muts-related protein, family n=1 Tax=hydrocarbon metagenome TaxID=938273 RepID=A0A0W8E504_9ZZZZ